MGEGPRESNGALSHLHLILVTPSATHNQTGPLWCWFPSGWACAHSRPLWVSLTTSPVRLGVSPAAAPTPMGVFSRRFEALFPCTGALGCVVCFAPCHWSPFLYALMWGHGVLPTALSAPFSTTLSPALSVYLCVNVGPQGLLVVRLPAPLVPHSASLGHLSQSHNGHASLLRPGARLRPSYGCGCMFLFLSTWCGTSLPFDFLSVLVVRGGAVCLPTPPTWFSHNVIFER